MPVAATVRGIIAVFVQILILHTGLSTRYARAITLVTHDREI